MSAKSEAVFAFADFSLAQEIGANKVGGGNCPSTTRERGSATENRRSGDRGGLKSDRGRIEKQPGADCEATGDGLRSNRGRMLYMFIYKSGDWRKNPASQIGDVQ